MSNYSLRISAPIILLVGMLLLLSSCNRNEVYREFVRIPGLMWPDGEALVFTPEIKEPNAAYKVWLKVRHSQAIPYRELSVLIKRTAPDGTVKEDRRIVVLADQNGKLIGEGTLDIFDVKEVIEEGKTFPEAGTYKYEIYHAMGAIKVLMVADLGIVVEKVPAN